MGMTHEEAIKVFDGLLNAFNESEHGDFFYDYDYGEAVCQAASVAISALREQDSLAFLQATKQARSDNRTESDTVKGVEFDQFKTNADHIRSMTDEELAETIIILQQRGIHFICKKLGYDAPSPEKIHDGDFKTMLDWLKQPYKEDT